MKNKLKTIVIFVVSILALIGLLGLIYSKTYISTNNAYIEAQGIPYYSKVSGRITQLNINNNSLIQKGEVIGQIDSTKYEEELLYAQNKLEKAKKELKISSQDVEKMDAEVNSDKDDIKSAKTNLENANSDYIRYKNAYQDGSVTKEDLANAIKNLETAKENFTKAQKNLEISSSSLESSISKNSSQNAQIQKLIEEVKQAKLNLSYTTLIAPIDGAIVKNYIEVGSYVGVEKPILMFDSKKYYVVASLEKKQIKKIKENQKALIKISKKTFKAHIDSIENDSIKAVFDEDISNYTFIPKASVNLKIKRR